MATTSTVMQSSAMSCSQQQRSSSSLSSRRISSSKRSIVSLNARKHRSASSSRKESVVVSASSAKIKVVGCGGGGGNAVNRMIEAGVSVSLHIYIHIVHSFSFFSQSALPFFFLCDDDSKLKEKGFKIFCAEQLLSRVFLSRSIFCALLFWSYETLGFHASKRSDYLIGSSERKRERQREQFFSTFC